MNLPPGMSPFPGFKSTLLSIFYRDIVKRMTYLIEYRKINVVIPPPKKNVKIRYLLRDLFQDYNAP